MMVKKIIGVIMTIAMVCCAQKHSCYEEQAKEKGRADANLVIETSPGSLNRENAVLHIRATEYQLLESGDTLAAQAYVKAAKQVLDSARVFD